MSFPYSSHGRKKDAARQAEDLRNIICYASINVVERITQDDDGLRIAFDNEVAVEKKSIAVEPPVNHVKQRQEGSGNTGIMHDGVAASAAGAQDRVRAPGRQKEHKREIDGIDQEPLAAVRPQPVENFRPPFGNPRGKTAQQGL